MKKSLKNSLVIPILCLVITIGILMKIAGDGLDVVVGPGMHVVIPPLPMSIQFVGFPTPTPTPIHLPVRKLHAR